MTRHAFITAHVALYPLRVLCRVLDVSRSWYQQRVAQAKSGGPDPAREARRRSLIDAIRRIFAASRQTYGAPRIHAQLLAEGWRIARKTVAKAMKQNNISPKRSSRRKPVTTNSKHKHRIAPNLLDRRFKIDRPKTVWLADITYGPTDEGWLYVAAVKSEPLCAIGPSTMASAICEIVGWGIEATLHSPVAERALEMAIQRHRPPEGLVHHSDRGVQYASDAYRKILNRHKLVASMSRKG